MGYHTESQCNKNTLKVAVTEENCGLHKNMQVASKVHTDEVGQHVASKPKLVKDLHYILMIDVQYDAGLLKTYSVKMSWQIKTCHSGCKSASSFCDKMSQGECSE